MKKVSLLILIALLVGFYAEAAIAAPEWVSLTKTATGEEPEVGVMAPEGGVPEMKVVPARDRNSVTIEINVPGFYRESKRAGKNDADFITTGISTRHMEKGMPELPALRGLVTVPEGAQAEAVVVAEDWAEIKMKNPASPSKGHMTRNVDPSKVEFEYSNFYGSKKMFPGMDKKVVVGQPFMMRDVRGAEVFVNAFQYDDAKKVMRVAKKMKVQVNFKGGSRAAVENKPVPYEFAEIYKRTFMNFVPAEAVARIELGNMLVIAHDSMYEETLPLVEWKKKQGFSVKIAKMSEVGASADDVYKYIKAEYDKTNLAYIILIGDAEFIPTLLGVKERAASDSCYTKLAGDDHVPDAIISRISAKNAADVKNQVAKIVHYEQFPDKGDAAAWYRRAIGIASAEGSPTDYERANWLRDGLMKYNYDKVDQIYDPRASKAEVAKSVNEGRGVINYIGHGSKNAWVTTNFGVSDALALKNGRMLPVIWSVACVNGAFKDGSDCFCEAWMKAGNPENPAGAAAIFGSSTNAEWVPPCDMQSEINLVQMSGEKQASVGALALTGVLKAMQTWGTAPNSSGVMLFEQYNMFGDCSMLVRTDVPKEVTYAAKRSGDKVEVLVSANGKPVKNARVAVSIGQNGETRSAVTNDEGVAAVAYEALKDAKNAAGSVTITGQNLVPVVDSTLSL